MAQDPYGFPDSSPAGGASSEASTALWLGVSAALLGSVGMCFCYVPYFVAVPLGATAAWKGYHVIAGASDVRDRTMATVALVAGSISALVSAAFAVFILMYAAFIVIYMGVVMAAVGFGMATDDSFGDAGYDAGAYDGAYEEGAYDGTYQGADQGLYGEQAYEAAPAEGEPVEAAAPAEEW